MLEYLTAGETHGKGLTLILRGLPSGLEVRAEYINRDLARRQRGVGRGPRMGIEQDQAEILSGVRHGVTLGSPISLFIKNRDWENWQKEMSVEEGYPQEIFTRPRPGHADLAGALKYNHRDIRNVLERASARETAARVAAGALAKRFLQELGVRVGSHAVAIGKAEGVTHSLSHAEYLELFQRADASPVRAGSSDLEAEMMAAIGEAKDQGDTLGGLFEVVALGVPVGLGSHVQWDEKLDGNIARALMSIQGVKGVEFGLGFGCARIPGSQVHDEIFHDGAFFRRRSNRAGGIEGGISNGEPIVVRVAMKPIPTLKRPLMSVDINTLEEVTAAHERSDVCALPAASVVGEAVVAFELAKAALAKFGGDNVEEVKRNFTSYIEYIEERSRSKKSGDV
jgi:chorismate synthase